MGRRGSRRGAVKKEAEKEDGTIEKVDDTNGPMEGNGAKEEKALKESEEKLTKPERPSIEEKWEWECCKNDDKVGGSAKCSNGDCVKHWHFKCLQEQHNYTNKELERIKSPEGIFKCPSCESKLSKSNKKVGKNKRQNKKTKVSNDIVDLEDLTESEKEDPVVLASAIAVDSQESNGNSNSDEAHHNDNNSNCDTQSESECQMKLDGFGFDDNELTEEQKAILAQRLQSQKNDWQEGLAKQRRLRLNEITMQFKESINQDISEEEACFIHDFCEKHQYDVSEKIVDEGVFFLESMREMLDEKKKQASIQAAVKAKTDKKREKLITSLMNNGQDDSEWECDNRDQSSSDDSDYSLQQGSEDDDVAPCEPDDIVKEKKSRTRTKKKVEKPANGEVSKRGARLLLDDALQKKDSFDGWSSARIKAYQDRKARPNAYYYRFNEEGEQQKTGLWADHEHALFMRRLIEMGANVQWGVFSMSIPGRVGYQCSNYYRDLVKKKWVCDPNYKFDGKKLTFITKSEKTKKQKMEEYREKAFSFIVCQDPSGVWKNLPACHSQAPDSVKEQNVNGKKVHVLNTGDIKVSVPTEEENKSKKGQRTCKNDKSKAKPKKNARRKKQQQAQVDAQSVDESKESRVANECDKNPNNASNCENAAPNDANLCKEIIILDEKQETTQAETIVASAVATDQNQSKRSGVKRKNPSNVVDALPPSKRRRTSRNLNKKDPNFKPSVHVEFKDTLNNNEILPGFIDIMTGALVEQPTLSPYGHVLGYDTWCKILRNPATKDTCPFTKQKLSRRSLIKLTKDNIATHRASIRNFNDDDRATASSS